MTDVTSRNRAVIEDFLDLFMVQKRVREAFEKHAAPGYIQHSPGFADGRDGTVTGIEQLFGSMPDGPLIDIKRVIVDGDLVAVHLHGRSGPNDPGIAGVDIFRLEDGKIVEHWDVVQPIPDSSIAGHAMV